MRFAVTPTLAQHEFFVKHGYLSAFYVSPWPTFVPRPHCSAIVQTGLGYENTLNPDGGHEVRLLQVRRSQTDLCLDEDGG